MPAQRFSPARLRSIREASGQSRVDLAFAVRRTEQSVYLWESGRTTPAVQVLEDIAAALEVPDEQAPETAAAPRTR